LAIDAADRAQALAKLDLVVGGDHRDRQTAERADDLDGLAAEPSRTSPNQHRVTGLHHVRPPAPQHAKRGRADQHVSGGRLPGQVRWFWQTLVLLHAGELREAAPVGLITPNALGGREHRILAGLDVWAVAIPDAAVDDHVIPNAKLRDR